MPVKIVNGERAGNDIAEGVHAVYVSFTLFFFYKFGY